MIGVRRTLSGLAALIAATPAFAALDVARLDRRLERLVATREDVIGLAVGVVDAGETVLIKGYGLTARAGEAVTEATVFRWASVSKGAAATLAVLIAEDGRLSLDAPVRDFMTTLRLPRAGARVRDVLSHRLGIVNNAYDLRLEDGRAPAAIRRSLGTLEPICAPGTCHGYQNVAFDAMAEILSEAARAPYDAVLRTRLFEPLAMSSAGLGAAALSAAPSVARPHHRPRGAEAYAEIPLASVYDGLPAAAGLVSDITDFTAYLRAQMGLRPEVLSTQTLETLHTPVVSTTREQLRLQRRYPRLERAEYALGWRVYAYAGRTLVGHRGGVDGYRALILFDPALRSGVVALWNSTSGRPMGLQFEVMDAIYDLAPIDHLQLDPEQADINP
ncbi:MAG: serine hydrolase domain-containing protein [Maricaulaceae bacterium]